MEILGPCDGRILVNFGYSIFRYNEGIKKTRKKLRTLNPIFQEIFSFTLEEDDIFETKVCIDLYDHDLVGSDDFMGQAVVDISSMNLSNELTCSNWFMLQQQVRYINIITIINDQYVLKYWCSSEALGRIENWRGGEGG